MTIDDLLPDPRNPRIITSQAALGLQASLRAFGDLGMAWNRTTGEMVSGHQRVAALRAEANRRGVELRVEEHGDHCFVILPSGDGMEERQFYCRIVEMSRAEQNVANLAANNPGIQGEFTADVDVLLAEAQESFPDLYDEMRLGEILEEVGNIPDTTTDEAKDAEPQIDRAAELAKTWGTKRGQIWEIPSKTVAGKSHRVMCADSLDPATIKCVLDGQIPDGVWSDAPYGMFLDADYSEAKSGPNMAGKRLKGGRKYANVIGDHEDFDPGPIMALIPDKAEQFWWGADYYAERIRNKNNGSWLVWDKRLDESTDRMYGSCFELCWSKQRHKRDMIRIKWAGVFGTEKEKAIIDKAKRVHPTQKPIALFEWFADRYLPEPCKVWLDPFAGTGISLLGAEHKCQIACCVELSPDYVAVILQRAADMGLSPRLIDEAKP